MVEKVLGGIVETVTVTVTVAVTFAFTAIANSFLLCLINEPHLPSHFELFWRVFSKIFSNSK